jgi:hypothetical protein
VIGVRPCGTYNTPSAHLRSTSINPAERVSEK